jgi:hypothetical protein
MKNSIKKVLISIIPKIVLLPLKNWLIRREIIRVWRKSGYSVPIPALVKQMVILNYQKKYNYYTKAKPTTIDYPSIKIKDDIIKKLREEITLLNEEIKDLKTDLKSFIEMES